VSKPRVNLTRIARIIPDTRPFRGPARAVRIYSRYIRHGVFAPNSQHRAWVTPAKRGRGNQRQATGEGQEPTPAERRAAMTGRSRRRTARSSGGLQSARPHRRTPRDQCQGASAWPAARKLPLPGKRQAAVNAFRTAGRTPEQRSAGLGCPAGPARRGRHFPGAGGGGERSGDRDPAAPRFCPVHGLRAPKRAHHAAATLMHGKYIFEYAPRRSCQVMKKLK